MSVPPSSDLSNPPQLGSLAQSARGRHLKQARRTLLAIGILTILLQVFLFATVRARVEKDVEREVQAGAAEGMVFDQAKLQEAKESLIKENYLITGGALALGVVFVALGLLVNRAPVPMCVTGLVLYIGGVAVFAMLNPITLIQGWIVKIIIVAALFKAVQAAVAYQKERDAARALEAI